MDNFSDNEHASSKANQASLADSQPTDATRRRFARNAVVGSAVVLSLANRTAWGQDVPESCLSNPTWSSYTPGVGFASCPPCSPDQQIKLDKADAIARAGLDQTTYPGYACPVPAQRTTSGDAVLGSKKDRTRDMLGKKP